MSPKHVATKVIRRARARAGEGDAELQGGRARSSSGGGSQHVLQKVCQYIFAMTMTVVSIRLYLIAYIDVTCL